MDKSEREPSGKDAPVEEKPRCPAAIRYPGADVDICDYRNTTCLLESGSECYIYDDYIKYLKEEDNES